MSRNSDFETGNDFGKSSGKGQSAKAPSLRLMRVNENVRHAIAAILSRGTINDKDLAKASITVTEVRTSPDLRNATIFVMPLGGDPDKKIVKALNKHSNFLRGELSRAVTMKYMPRLKFLLDDSFDEATLIDGLLRDPHVAQDLQDLNATDDQYDEEDAADNHNDSGEK